MLENNAITAPVGAISSSLPRHCTQAAIMPASLTCIANAVTASAIANTPKSAGESSRARTSPSANEATLVPRVPRMLHVNPRPALRPILSMCSVLVALAVASSDPLKPYLPPEWDELAWTAGVVHTGTDDVFQHDAGGLHRHHLAGPLVQALRHTGLNAGGTTAVARHFLLKAHAAIEPVLVEG